MNITYFLNKIKGRAGEHSTLLLTLILLVFVGVGGFYLGYTAQSETAQAAPVVIECPQEAYIAPQAKVGGSVPLSTIQNTQASSGQYVASKNGSKYYPASCKGVSRIKEENKVWFATAAEAEADGYTLASGC